MKKNSLNSPQTSSLEEQKFSKLEGGAQFLTNQATIGAPSDSDSQRLNDAIQSIEELGREVAKSKRDVEKQNDLTVLGFMFLLVIVAGIVIDAFTSKVNTNQEMIKSLESLRAELQTIERHQK